jgi:hypothetical protein
MHLLHDGHDDIAGLHLPGAAGDAARPCGDGDELPAHAERAVLRDGRAGDYAGHLVCRTALSSSHWKELR